MKRRRNVKGQEDEEIYSKCGVKVIFYIRTVETGIYFEDILEVKSGGRLLVGFEE